MQKVIHTFRVNVAYKSIPVSSLFSTDSKAVTPPHETSNVCYEFKCECKSSYIKDPGTSTILERKGNLLAHEDLSWISTKTDKMETTGNDDFTAEKLRFLYATF